MYCPFAFVARKSFHFQNRNSEILVYLEPRGVLAVAPQRETREKRAPPRPTLAVAPARGYSKNKTQPSDARPRVTQAVGTRYRLQLYCSTRGRGQGPSGEEELGTELHSQEFPISKAAVNQTFHTPIYLVKRYSHREWHASIQ